MPLGFIGSEWRIACRHPPYELCAQPSLGISVVSDSCNLIELTRREWEQVALDAQANFVNIELICSDPIEHRHRVETRCSTIPGLRLPTWIEVEERKYHPWTVDRIVIDTANRPDTECVAELLFETAHLRI